MSDPILSDRTRWSDLQPFYKLRCVTCAVDFPPMLSTDPMELLAPDYEETERQAGAAGADSLRHFHRLHRGHELDAQPTSTD